MEKNSEDLAVQESQALPKEPPRYTVVLHNDNYTTMDFVVEVLKRHFRKTKEEAVQIMLSVHEYGKGVAGVFSLQIAETKVAQVHDLARARGFPLRCSVEPDGSPHRE